METHETTFRIGAETAKLIKYDIVAKSDNYSSLKNFCEKSIGSNISTISSHVSGNYTLLTLINLLDTVRGFDEPCPELDTEAVIKNESLSERQVNIEIPTKQLGMLNDIKDGTELEHAWIIRRCIFRHLFRISQESDHLNEWKTQVVNRTWTELKNELILPKSRFHEILHRRFVLFPDTTIAIAEEDPEFIHFAEEYEHKFYRTDCYEEMVELFGDTALNATENVIEELTSYSFEKSSSVSLWD